MNDKQTENQAYKDKSNGSEISRRGFLSSAALATVAGTLAVNGAMAKDRQQANDRSKSDPGPSNRPLDTQNPDSEWPPDTGSKSLVRNFKYPFSFANKRTYERGWSREVTIRELPVSKAMAGVNMRLTAGGVRELHCHCRSRQYETCSLRIHI